MNKYHDGMSIPLSLECKNVMTDMIDIIHTIFLNLDHAKVARYHLKDRISIMQALTVKSIIIGGASELVKVFTRQ
jgi:hypothetical protein